MEEQTVWQRIGSGFKQNLRDIGEDMEDFFVWLVTYSPQLVLWAVIIAAVIVLLRRSSRKRKAQREKRMTPPQNPDQEQN